MNSPSFNIRKLTSHDIDAAADLLARAFFDYPMLQWILPDEAHRRASLPVFMRVSVRWGLLMNVVFGIGDPLRGVAIWAPPGMADADLDPDDKIVRYEEAAAALGREGKGRMDRFVAEQRVLRDRHIGPRTWYLPWLGIDPARQRSGIGGALLTHMFERLDLDGDDIYLETEKAANVPYYERHGFKVVTEGVISGSGPQYWTMRRTPTAAPIG